MMSKVLRLAGAAALSLSAITGAAQAGGFALREQSAIGLGNAFAGSAAGGSGLASMYWNPATMADFAGLQSSVSLFAVVPYSEITPTGGFLPTAFGKTPTGDIAQDAALPASYTTWQITDKIWLGLAINTPFGLVTQNPYSWSGQIYGRTSKVESMNATPSVAYKVNDWLSLGAGMQIMNFKVRLSSANDGAASVLPTARSGELKGDDTAAIGYTLGFTVKPWQGGEIGVGYRSRVSPKLTGTLVTPGGVPPSAASAGLPPGAYDITAGLTLPDQVTVGVKQKITSDFTLLGGFEWTHWGMFGRFPVFTTSGTLANTLYFDYRNSWFASLGGEYAVNTQWTVRAGVGFERSPITNETRSVRLPDSDRTWATLGASYKWNDKLSFDASYAHLFAKSGTINVVPGNPNLSFAPGPTALTFTANTKSHVDLFAIGLTYRWDDPKIAVPVVRPPLVTKG
ncbi:MAG: 47 kDa outer membrane protein precursor [Hyphomicrobiales bacterium]|jgi:long-chain fatty acid transport protein|nr:47 kDa outer membrane protein precursor [Hyphomicrobiales bacterium]